MFRVIVVFSLLLVTAFSCKKDNDYSAIDKKIIEDYLTANNLTAQSTPSGLYYIVAKPGDAIHPTNNSSVSAYYNGYLINGVTFDQTTTKPATFPFTNVISGWKEGLQLIGTGGKIKLLIPSALGYGSSAQYNSAGAIIIPKNSVIIFDVELVGITK